MDRRVEIAVRIPLALPALRTAGRFPLGDRGFCTTYAHQGSHALHLHDYRAIWRCGGADHHLQPGTITISPSGVPTAYDLPSSGRHWCVHFRVAEAGADDLGLPLLVYAGAGAAYARERLARVSALHERACLRNEAATAVGAAAAFLELLVWLAQQADDRPRGDRGGAAAERAARLLREQPDHSWTTVTLARRVGVSAPWLAAGFRRRFAMTVARYRLVQRIERARILLATSALPVAEIGRLVGIPDQHQFNKRFRQVTGMAPSASRGRLDRHRV
jgi:AraC-like DNA-binding protein